MLKDNGDKGNIDVAENDDIHVVNAIDSSGRARLGVVRTRFQVLRENCKWLVPATRSVLLEDAGQLRVKPHECSKPGQLQQGRRNTLFWRGTIPLARESKQSLWCKKRWSNCGSLTTRIVSMCLMVHRNVRRTVVLIVVHLDQNVSLENQLPPVVRPVMSNMKSTL